MGTKVLATTFSGTNKIRAYAHCARDSVCNSVPISSATSHRQPKKTSSPKEFTLNLYSACVLLVQPGITLLLINLSGNTTTQVSVTVTTQGTVAAHKHGARKHVGGRKFRHVHGPSFTGVDEAAGTVRDEYHLTPRIAT
ncbi:unnamed protein product [Miscanthus lutarioriparius]|uniref:Uncharacterized protein n=1 Tax=Miscanthus lutarioriparius TaxID=422564 RepID=A0A811R6Q8_9POAL|nr:unnamed protein product [Miscanthus lutarioriparius]